MSRSDAVSEPKPIRTRPTPWDTVILVCGKCSRKLDGGYGEKSRDTLRTALNDTLRGRGQRRAVRIVETKCFGLCPKKAVVALNASRPAAMLTIPRGTAPDEILSRLAVAPTLEVPGRSPRT